MQDIGNDDTIEGMRWDVHGMEISGNGIDTTREAHVLCLCLERLENVREVEGRHARVRETFGYRQAPDTRASAYIENMSWLVRYVRRKPPGRG